MNGNRRCVFITGGTGYLGRPLIAELLRRGHELRALVRRGSESKLPAGAKAIVSDALNASYAGQIGLADTFVQLVGVSHPNPSKAEAFRSVDLVSARAAVDAARSTLIKHFVYVSVAQPAPVMKAYVQVRAECEAMIRESRLNATILRPWYVLGPGHRWPYVLKPFYWILEMLPSTRQGAMRLGLVTLSQMVRALAFAVEHPAPGVRTLGVSEIRACKP